jgi:hypothetical protein
LAIGEKSAGVPRNDLANSASFTGCFINLKITEMNFAQFLFPLVFQFVCEPFPLVCWAFFTRTNLSLHAFSTFLNSHCQSLFCCVNSPIIKISLTTLPNLWKWSIVELVHQRNFHSNPFPLFVVSQRNETKTLIALTRCIIPPYLPRIQE